MQPSFRTWGFYVIVSSCITLIFTVAIISTSIFTLLDIGEIFELFYSQFYRNGVYVALFSGMISFMICFLSQIGVLYTNRFFLILCGVLHFICLVLLIIAAISVVSFPVQMGGEPAIDHMEETLVYLFNRTSLITAAWEKAQTKMRCCAVRDKGWLLYRKSYWSNFTNVNARNIPVHTGNSQELLGDWSPFYKMVPESCCFRIIDEITHWPTDFALNIPQCQNFQFGPPKFVDGPQNDAVYYRGCFNNTVSYVHHYGKYFGTLYLFGGLFQIFACVSCIFYLTSKSDVKSE